jgi:hypothetical protein
MIKTLKYTLLFFLMGKTFAGPIPTPTGEDFYNLHIPSPSATWKSTLVFTDTFHQYQTKKAEYSFWYKHGKLKKANNTPGDLPQKKFFVEILTREALIEYNLPQATGYRYPPDCRMNFYYHAPGSTEALRDAGLTDIGESGKVDGVPCEIYAGSPFPQMLMMSPDNYYKEWRAQGGFVMKKETYMAGPKGSYHSVEEVRHFKANAVVPDSIFDVPATVKLGDGAQWLRDHAFKPPTFIQRLKFLISHLNRLLGGFLRGR